MNNSHATEDSLHSILHGWEGLAQTARAILTLIMGAGVVVALFHLLHIPEDNKQWLTLLLVFLAFATSPIHLPLARYRLSLGVLFVFALLLSGVTGIAVVVGGLSTALGRMGDLTLRRRSTWHDLALHLAAGVLSTAAAAAVIGYASALDETVRLVAQVGIITVVWFTVHVFFMAVAAYLNSEASVVDGWRELASMLPAFLGIGCIAGLLVWTMRSGPVLGVLVAPLVVFLYRASHLNRQRVDAERKHATEIERLYLPTMAAIAAAIQARDAADGEHHVRVQRLALALAEELGVKDEVTLRAVRFGSLLHDLGRLAISDAILLKEDALTPGERRQLQMHPVLGAELIRHIPFGAPVAESIRHHHEWWDGGGYPEGLEGDAIPFPARLIAVAETYDTITVPPRTRKRRDRQDALKEISRVSGLQFDPAVVGALPGALRRVDQQQATDTLLPKTALDVIASGALSQSLELNLSKALRETSSYDEVLVKAAEIGNGVLPVDGWLLLTTEPGAPTLPMTMAGEGMKVLVEEIVIHMHSIGPAGERTWSLSSLNHGGQVIILSLPDIQGLRWDLALRLSGEEGGELLTSALSQALVNPLSAAITRISEMAAGLRLALTDPLTGLGNRLDLEQHLNGLKTDEAMGVLLLDLNNFKGINDHFGHDVGDDALRKVGACLKAAEKLSVCARTFRTGGDEFVLLARPGADKRTLDALRDTIRHNIQEINIEVGEDEFIPMSSSIGRAWTASVCLGTEELFKAADQDMYEDKRANPKRQARGERPRTVSRDGAALSRGGAFSSLSSLSGLLSIARRGTQSG